MFQITDYNKMLLSIGDSASFSLEIIDDDGKLRSPQDGDVLKFKIYDCENTYLVKVADIVGNKFVFIINPLDTKDLAPALYTYNIVLTNGDESQYTVISPAIFELEGGC